MKQEIDIGVVCLARRTFDFNAASNLYKQIQVSLTRIPHINWEFLSELIVEIDDARKAADLLNKKRIDALVCISGTFALGHLVLELVKVLHVPILLWGLDELPYSGGKIRLNSVCGVNLNASNLYKSGIPNFHVVIGDKIDDDWLDAIRLIKHFKTTRVGLLGHHAYGFFNLDIDELSLFKELGVLIDHYELSDVYNTQVTLREVDRRKSQLEGVFDTSELSIGQLEKLAELITKISNFMANQDLNALAIRCWPEFARDYSIAPCAAMSLLQSEGLILSCEGDVLGSISMLAHQAIGAKTPFLADFSQINRENDTALLWHCGVAPCSTWDGDSSCTLDTYFANGKGVTAGFVMKPGRVSLLRIDYALGRYRVFIQAAEGIPMTKALKGTYLNVKFPGKVLDVLNKIVKNGIAHHISVVYGDYLKPFEILAKIKNWELIK